MPTIAFILTMPGNNAWNGKWTGEGKLYAVVRSYTKKKAAEMVGHGSSHGHNFGDGWYARVSVKEVGAIEARQLRKNTQGFCGYEWMIDSIESWGKILDCIQLQEALEKLEKARAERTPPVEQVATQVRDGVTITHKPDENPFF